MPRRPKTDMPVLEGAVDELVQRASAGEKIIAADFDAVAIATTYSARHVRRVFKNRLDGISRKDPSAFIDDRVITVVFLMAGNLQGAHRYLEKQGVPVPSLTTFKVVVKRTLGTDQLAYAAGGSKRFRDFQGYLTMERSHRMHTIELDHTELPIFVLPRGNSTTAVKPWITAAVDSGTGYVLSWAITMPGKPTADEVRSVLAAAFMYRIAPDGETVVGGRPYRALWDRGLEFLSELITESCLRLGVLPVALPGYSPHLKPRVERLWRFVKEDLLPPLPGYNAGPEDLRGNRAAANWSIGEDEFLVRCEEWMDWYTLEHRINGERTPLEEWKADTTPLTFLPDDLLWHDMLRSSEVKVSKNGIRFDKIDYTAPEVTGLVGRKVEIRHLQHDRSFIEVFDNGDHVCTAHPKTSLSADERAQVIEHRNKRRQLAAKRSSAANGHRRKSARGPVTKTTLDHNGNRVAIEPAYDLTDDTSLTDVIAVLDAQAQQTMF